MEPPRPGMKRVTAPRQKCPNPLFEQWLSEWRQEAEDKGSEMRHCFGKALKTLRKYPLLLRNGRECMILESFGNRLCQLLDRKLADYRKTHPEIDDILPNQDMLAQVAVPPAQRKKRKSPLKKKTISTPNAQDFEEEASEPPEKVPRRNSGKKYVPAWRSGPFAILITLLKQEEKPSYPGFMSKAELVKEAQPLCDKSFTRPDPGCHYTSWSSMAQLVKKGLVSRCSSPAKFSLTNEGRDLARLLKNHEKDSGESGDPYLPRRISMTSEEEHQPRAESNSSSVSFKSTTAAKDWKEVSSGKAVLPTRPIVPKVRNQNGSPKKKNKGKVPSSNDYETSVILESGTFDVLLLVDTCETGGATKRNHNQTVSELTQMNVPFEVRRLEVGDFLWIARSRSSKDSELVLPYIVERKRMDDLGGSIKDGRFKEQKFRLRQSGIQNLIYLVESHGSNQHVGLPLSTLEQAAVNTQVVDGFIVKHTIDHRHSMAYLASLTRILGRMFLNKTLLGCLKKDLADYTISNECITLMNFNEFKQSTKKNKNFSVKEMFVRQLVQLKGLSVEKAIAIVGRYPTPQALIQACKFGGDETLLADIPCRGTTTCRNVGLVTSKAVFLMFSTEKLH